MFAIIYYIKYTIFFINILFEVIYILFIEFIADFLISSYVSKISSSSSFSLLSGNSYTLGGCGAFNGNEFSINDCLPLNALFGSLKLIDGCGLYPLSHSLLHCSTTSGNIPCECK